MKYLNEVTCGDSLNLLKELPDDSVHAVITDPPYNLSFLGKKWDSHEDNKEFQLWCEKWAKECLRVLKPGACALVFGSPRTHHRLTCALEDAGFKIVDELHWVYATGLCKGIAADKLIDKKLGVSDQRKDLGSNPNSRTNDKGYGELGFLAGKEARYSEPASGEAKKWEGWGVGYNLKPAWEPIILAIKEPEGSFTENILKHEVGAINIDACRIPLTASDSNVPRLTVSYEHHATTNFGGGVDGREGQWDDIETGRVPSNIILTDPVFAKGTPEVVMKRDGPAKGHSPNVKLTGFGEFGGGKAERDSNKPDYYINDGGDYNKFFLIPKASKSEKEKGLKFEGEPEVQRWNSAGEWKECKKEVVNKHPTVKPINLLEHLIKMVTRENQIVLDPFVGSGSTAIACMNLKRNFVVFELDEGYCKIARRRILAAEPNQKSLMDYETKLG